MDNKAASVAEQGAEATFRAGTDIEKNSRETLRVGLVRYRDQDFVTARIWYRTLSDDSLRPSNNGFMLRLSKLPELMAAIAQVDEAARGEGLL